MNCPKCKTDLTRKQEYDLIYGKDGEHQITCQKCKHEFVVVRRFHRTKPENAFQYCKTGEHQPTEYTMKGGYTRCGKCNVFYKETKQEPCEAPFRQSLRTLAKPEKKVKP